MAHENEVLSDIPYYSSSSLDNESRQNEYDKFCKASLRIINKNNHLKAKNELLQRNVDELKNQAKNYYEKKEISNKCDVCNKLEIEINSLKLKLASFENSSSSLRKMVEMQKPSKDKCGLGYTENIACSSNTKIKNLGPQIQEMPSVEPALPVPLTTEPACSDEQHRVSVDSAENGKILESNIIKKNDSVLITKKSILGTPRNSKQPPILKLGQGHGKSRIQTPHKMTHRRSSTLYPKSNYHQVGWDYETQQEQLFRPPMYNQWSPYPPFPYRDQPNDDTSTLWHRRLGHANMRLLQSLSFKELVRNLPKLKFKAFCDACNIGKQVHESHKAKNMVSTTKCLELLHMDLFGPSAVQSYGGNFYTLVIVDDYSRYTWTRFLKHKNEAFDHFEILSKKIQVQKGCPIISIRTDHGREFDNEVQFGAFCDANGITHNFSAPRTPQSNGVVERKNRTLQEMARTMLNEQSIPQKFWCNAVDTSTYILNRILIRPFLGKTPYELFKGKKPSLEHFKVFGSKCFILNTKDYLTKFDPKSTEGVFLGYSPNSKAYIVLNKETMKVEESLNVKFDETPPPKSSPLVDDDILENDIIEDQDKDLEIKENEPLNKEISNIKSSKDHTLETVIGNLNERSLISQVQNQSNFFCFVCLWYPKGTGLETIVYADSDHVGDYVDRKSTSGVCTFVGCCLTSWFSKKQTALAISTTEAEYVSAEKACQQALWMKQALVDYDIKLDDIPVLCDNKGAIDLSKNPVLHSRTKHIEIRHHFLRDNVQKGNITIEKVNSEDNIADILTKPLKREPFNLLRLGLGLMEPNA
ncbi:retrovirus-related pol polyprotein from transposon TNT 1-94 [Tanacetum coccineum]